MKYNLESWKKTQWKGTARQTTITVNRFVMRDKKGHFAKNKPVIYDVKERSDSTGIYYVGYVNGKIKTRKLKERKIQYGGLGDGFGTKSYMYRTSYVLNNVPISKDGYFGFRIVCFSTDKELLSTLKYKMKEKLIDFIEECIKYSKDEFWFDMYFGYEAPTLNNIPFSEKGKYSLTMENKFGTIIKEKSGELRNL